MTARCGKCGYSREGLPTGARCPECGAAPSSIDPGKNPRKRARDGASDDAPLAMAQPNARELAALGMLPRPCPKCGYNLVGHRSTEPCPQCGAKRISTGWAAPAPGAPGPPGAKPTPTGTTTSAQPSAARGPIITEHTPCASCGYDLFGLPIAGSCPECGRPFVKPQKIGGRRATQSLCEAPHSFLRRLQIGFIAMALGIVMLTTTFALLAGPRPGTAVLSGRGGSITVPIVRFQPFLPQAGGPTMMLIAGVLWAGGLFLVSGPLPKSSDRTDEDVRLWRRLSIAARATQVVWAIVPAIALLMLTLPAPHPIVGSIITWSARILLVVGAVGWWAVAILGAELADWASDSDLSFRLRVAVMTMGLGSLLTILGSFVPDSFGGLFFDLWGWLVAGAVILAAGAFLFSIFSLARLMGDAIWISRQMVQRDRRLIAKMDAERAAHAAALAAAPLPDAPDLTRRIGTAPGRPPGQPR